MGNNNSSPNKEIVSKVDYSIRAPYDKTDSRFIQSFTLESDLSEISMFYELYGFIVFDNILNDVEISRSIKDLWAAYPGTSVDTPETWDRIAHPYSFVGNQPIGGVQLWDNRQHARVYRAFQLGYEAVTRRPLNEPLVACLDRGSLMLPTTGPLGRRDWLASRIPHFDLNPYIWLNLSTPDPNIPSSYCYQEYEWMLSEGNNTAGHGYPKLRAVLQLSQSTELAGGFECMVGFHRQLELWCREHPLGYPTVNPYGWGVPEDSPIHRNMQKITVRAGSLVLFSAELPHSMFPNESDQFRYAQYMRMTPLSTLELTEELRSMRQKLVLGHLPPDLVVTDIGKEVFLL